MLVRDAQGGFFMMGEIGIRSQRSNSTRDRKWGRSNAEFKLCVKDDLPNTKIVVMEL